MDDLCVQPQAVQHLPEEDKALVQAVQQGQMEAGPQNLQRHAGKTRARPHVDQGVALLQFGQQQDAVQKVLDHHGLRLGDRGQVHLLIPLDQQFHIPLKLLRLPVGHSNPIGRRTLLQILPDVLAHAFPSFASQINSTEMSAGLTPLMRDAWPIFAGMTFCSFSCASSRRPVMVL